jgi:hypothetical protein
VNFRDEAIQIAEDLGVRTHTDCDPNECPHHDMAVKRIEGALQDAFNKGMRHVTVDRSKVSVHGTDGCMNCDHGRITIYAGSRYCIECQHKAEKSR